MYKVKNFKIAQEFVDFNEKFIYSNLMENIFLIKVINEVAKNNLTVFQAFNLIGNKNVQILVLVVDGYCLIYCNKFDINSLEILSTELPFERLMNFTFAGDKETIESLLNLKKLQFVTEKHLTIYKCEKLNKEFKVASGKMRLAISSDQNKLANLSVDFTAEYDGNKESLANMMLAVASEIANKSLFVWEDGKICAMAIEMNRQQFNFPEIGKLYTVPHQRNKNYSSSLVFKMTEKILLKNSFCMLYTHGGNIASNRAIVKVGYSKTADYVRIIIKN